MTKYSFVEIKVSQFRELGNGVVTESLNTDRTFLKFNIEKMAVLVIGVVNLED